MSWSFDHHSLLSGTMIRIKFFWTLVKKGNAETYLQILSTPLDDFKRTFFQKFEWVNAYWGWEEQITNEFWLIPL